MTGLSLLILRESHQGEGVRLLIGNKVGSIPTPAAIHLARSDKETERDKSVALTSGHSPGKGRLSQVADGGSNPIWHVIWGCSSVGGALQWHCRGQGFEAPQLHRTLTKGGGSQCKSIRS